METAEFGNAMCFDYCPSILHRYAVTGETEDVERMVATAFRADGWSVVAGGYELSFSAVTPDGAIEALLAVAPESSLEPDEGHHEQRPSVPADHVLVDVSVGENRTT